MKRVMGIDASSTTIALAIIDYNDTKQKLVCVEYYKPPKSGNIFERLSKVAKTIQAKIIEFNPCVIALEDIVLFMRGQSTAKTITTLAVLNRTVGSAIYAQTGSPPYLYSVMKIRHAIKNKILPTKADIPELVASILDIKFPYKKNKNGKIIEENYDMADAIACALAHIKLDREGQADNSQIKKPKKRKMKGKTK